MKWVNKNYDTREEFSYFVQSNDSTTGKNLFEAVTNAMLEFGQGLITWRNQQKSEPKDTARKKNFMAKLLERLRAPSHVKFRPGVKLSIWTRVEKKLLSHLSFNPGQNEYF